MITLAPSPHAPALAAAAARTAWRNLPAEVRAQAEDLVMDTVAVIAAGGAHPSYRAFRDGQGAAAGPCTVIGGGRTGELQAALVNGGATTVLQLQDGHRMARGHPASHLVPVLLALAQGEGRTLEAVMGALVAGYEVGARVGMALGGFNPYLHDAGSWACVGAAAGAAHLLSGGDAAAIAEAIEGCAATASMGWRETPANGATVHHLYIGLGCVTALTAARAAQAGLQSMAGALDGYFGPRIGAAFDADRLTDGIGADGRWSRFETLGGYIKVHPLCAHLSGAADAVVGLAAERPAAPDEVEAVEVAIYSHALEYDGGDPVNDLAARFSAKAAVAAALRPGGLTSRALDDGVGDAAFTALMRRVSVVHDPALDALYPQGRPARVTLKLAGGETVTRTVVHPLGDSTNPTDRAQRRDKAKALLDEALGSGRFERAAEALEDVAAAGSLDALMAALGR